MKKIYVGGCFDDYLEVRNIQNIFVSNGFEITYDWTIKVYPCFCIHLDTKDRITHILFVHKYIYARIEINAEKIITHRNKLSNDMRTFDKLQEEAILDMNGVYQADWSIFIITRKDYVYRGTFFELGASIMRDTLRNKRNHTIIISSVGKDTYAKTLCFYHHPDIIHVNTIDEALYFM